VSAAVNGRLTDAEGGVGKILVVGLGAVDDKLTSAIGNNRLIRHGVVAIKGPQTVDDSCEIGTRRKFVILGTGHNGS
jgi:hypothetical protein